MAVSGPEKRQEPQGTPPRAKEAPSAVARVADGIVVGIARHWLLLVNLAVAIYLFLPLTAPLLAKEGYDGPARVIYSLYSFSCHQLPERSYFLFGEQPLYSIASLEAAGMPPGGNLFQRRLFTGNLSTGYKTALCQRDIAIYGTVLLTGLLFGLVRRRLRAPSVKIYLLFLIPIALDGFTQLFGLRMSNWWLRTITGAIFGGASVWLAYPYLEEAMNGVLRTELSRRN
ncbi:MAG: DUF2085 domain-containing protein [Caldilineaceae bacterium]|nr:DUF2085 domain-containing protein [Caldilineaceae bacterium]HRJ44983.1 DUF2085 domain-containing protein [Caldilineaceae bacterium]